MEAPLPPLRSGELRLSPSGSGPKPPTLTPPSPHVFTPIKPTPSVEAPGSVCLLPQNTSLCEWCALGVKTRSAFGRDWPYAEHPVTRYHYCLEPVEAPSGGLVHCCAFRSKPIKTSQGYSGHLTTHRTGPSGLAFNSHNAANGVNGLHGGLTNGSTSSSSSDSDSGHSPSCKRPRRSSAPSQSHGGFKLSLQPSLPRCDLEADQFRFFLLPQDSCSTAISVVVKGHRGKLVKNAVRDPDGIYMMSCPPISELLPPNDSRTTFEISVRVIDAANRLLFQTSVLCAKPCVNEPTQQVEGFSETSSHIQTTSSMPLQVSKDPDQAGVLSNNQDAAELVEGDVQEKVVQTHAAATKPTATDKAVDGQEVGSGGYSGGRQVSTLDKHGIRLLVSGREESAGSRPPLSNGTKAEREAKSAGAVKLVADQKVTKRKAEHATLGEANIKQPGDTESTKRPKVESLLSDTDGNDLALGFDALARLAAAAAEDAETRSRSSQAGTAASEQLSQPTRGTMSEILQSLPQNTVTQLVHAITSDNLHYLSPAASGPTLQSISDYCRRAGLPSSDYSLQQPLLLPTPFPLHLMPSPMLGLASTSSAPHSTSSSAGKPSLSRSTSRSALPRLSAARVLPPSQSSPSSGGQRATGRSGQAPQPSGSASARTSTHAVSAGATCAPPKSTKDTAQKLAKVPGVMTRAKSKENMKTPDATAATTPPQGVLSRADSADTTASRPTIASPALFSRLTPTSLVPMMTYAIGATTEVGSGENATSGQMNVALKKQETCLFYFYTVLPEKGKLIWVVFFSSRRYLLEPFELLLHEIAQSPALMPKDAPITPIFGPSSSISTISGSPAAAAAPSDYSSSDMTPASSPVSSAPSSPSQPNTESGKVEMGQATEVSSSTKRKKISLVLPSLPELSWIAEGVDCRGGGRLYQHKVCFQAPESTFERRIFSATLHHRAESCMILLGGLSLVSTTSQREPMWHRINQWFPGKNQKRLVQNCRQHPPSRRHFVNGKGSRQGSKHAQKDRFLVDEYLKSVELDVMHVIVTVNQEQIPRNGLRTASAANSAYMDSISKAQLLPPIDSS